MEKYKLNQWVLWQSKYMDKPVKAYITSVMVGCFKLCVLGANYSTNSAYELVESYSTDERLTPLEDECTQQDIENLIDIALLTGDVEWCRELSSRLEVSSLRGGIK